MSAGAASLFVNAERIGPHSAAVREAVLTHPSPPAVQVGPHFRSRPKSVAVLMTAKHTPLEVKKPFAAVALGPPPAHPPVTCAVVPCTAATMTRAARASVRACITACIVVIVFDRPQSAMSGVVRR